MIGHKILQELSLSFSKVYGLVRNHKSKHSLLQNNKNELIVCDLLKGNVINILNDLTPDVVINAIGITIRRGVDINLKNTIYLNSYLPHLLSEWCDLNNKYLIHFSTDCVFSGLKGNYNDEDIPDAVDIYGRTKGLGEVNNSTGLTIRSSMIGREMYNHTELLEWILSKKNDTIEGFKNVIYSGVTTTFMAKAVSQIILNHSQLRGIYNVSSEPISKYDLAAKINDLFQLNIDIKPEINKESNKSLDCSKFKKETKISIPNWDQLLFDLKNDSIKNTALYEN